MPVTVDHAPLRTEELGLLTVGQVLAHLQRENRLVVNVLIDGQAPDLNRLGDVRKSSIGQRTIFIETADPRQMALEILEQVSRQLDQADDLKNQAADLLQKNQPGKAMQNLATCFAAWQHAQKSLAGTAQLLKINLDDIRAGDATLNELLGEVTSQLKQIKSALENRDFVTLTDLLVYETTQIGAQWRQAIDALRQRIG
jgi:hypothetical protein